MEIRLATQADFEQVGVVFAEENRFHADLVPEIIQVADPIMTHDWYDDVLGDPEKILFVAEIEKEILGVALAAIKNNSDDPIFTKRRYITIDEIAVAAAHRGQGVGRALMERIHRWGRAQGIVEFELQVWERNDQAIGFYEKLGYQKWRRTLLFIDDEEATF